MASNCFAVECGSEDIERLCWCHYGLDVKVDGTFPDGQPCTCAYSGLLGKRMSVEEYTEWRAKRDRFVKRLERLPEVVSDPVKRALCGELIYVTFPQREVVGQIPFECGSPPHPPEEAHMMRLPEAGSELDSEVALLWYSPTEVLLPSTQGHPANQPDIIEPSMPPNTATTSNTD